MLKLLSLAILMIALRGMSLADGTRRQAIPLIPNGWSNIYSESQVAFRQNSAITNIERLLRYQDEKQNLFWKD